MRRLPRTLHWQAAPECITSKTPPRKAICTGATRQAARVTISSAGVCCAAFSKVQEINDVALLVVSMQIMVWASVLHAKAVWHQFILICNVGISLQTNI